MPATEPSPGRWRPGPGLSLALGVILLLGLGLGLVALGSFISDDTDLETTGPPPESPTAAARTTPDGPRAEATTTVAPATTAAPTTTVVPTTTTPGRVGVFAVAPGQGAVVGSGPLKTYSVEVEEAVGLDSAEVGAVVDAALSDPRSWIASGEVSFQRIESGGDLKIVLATPATVDELCFPLKTAGMFSCRNRDQLNINADRWRNSTADWPLGVDAYRNHVINHEMGHALGYGHVGCPGPGERAPVMMQQTKGLEGCMANEWPYPATAG